MGIGVEGWRGERGIWVWRAEFEGESWVGFWRVEFELGEGDFWGGLGSIFESVSKKTTRGPTI